MTERKKAEIWPPLFDVDKCPAAIADKVDFDFIQDCTILPAPPPIFDCPDIEIPPDIPVPVPPCPVLTVAGDGNNSFSVNTNLSVMIADCLSTFTGIGNIHLGITPGECCDYVFDIGMDLDLDLQLCIPPFDVDVPCPEINVLGSATLDTGYGNPSACLMTPRLD